jgi:hypothetical protein
MTEENEFDANVPPATPRVVKVRGIDEYPPHDSTGITVQGRNWKRPVVRVRADGDGFTLLVDDAENPELWLQVFISEDVAFAWARFATTDPRP